MVVRVALPRLEPWSLLEYLPCVAWQSQTSASCTALNRMSLTMHLPCLQLSLVEMPQYDFALEVYGGKGQLWGAPRTMLSTSGVTSHAFVRGHAD